MIAKCEVVESTFSLYGSALALDIGDATLFPLSGIWVGVLMRNFRLALAQSREFRGNV
ncbi:hypothetical protein M011DRAFT_469721 [Sporormia fimetaria CBS 119925]|uniref:Uncharacterized protein n=1 Tax=Sporormia fimetaria CBS 119925 TaxID=1340428 RepID=A0A6A6V6K3_9PLEO|nr:hypothetical protein M011DRAFT_469721 [Sporormia fimetaria CBS 119925]